MTSIDKGPETAGSGTSAEDETELDQPTLWRTARNAGLITAAISGLGLIGLATGIIAFTSILPGYKATAISAALIWLFLGLVLAFHAVRPLTRRPALAVQAVLAGVAILEAIELGFSLRGSHSVVETSLIQLGSTHFGHLTTPISPASSALIIPASLALFFLLASTRTQKQKQQREDAAGIIGLVIAILAFTALLSYGYGAPLLQNTTLTPIAPTSALAGFFMGVGLIAAAGPGAIPLKHFSGSSIRGRLLRVFVPLIVILILAQNFIFVIIVDQFQVRGALLLSISIVFFVFVTAGVITRFSDRIGRDLDEAEEALVHKNEALAAINEELTGMSEELRANNDELLINERALQESLQRNTFLSDILDRSSQPFGVGYADGRLGIVNHAFEELTGYTADELQRMDWAAALTPPEWLDGERKSLEELHRTGKPVRYEKEYIKKDGTRVAVELLVHLVADEDGTPQYYYSFITDITRQKRNREILSLSNQILQSVEGHHTLQPLLEEYVRILQEYTGCDSVGIRILDEKGNIPYLAYTGFSRDFYELENPLSVETDRCMCINVIKGTTDPSLPIYTANGSFIVNATTKFLATVSEEEKGETRNVCIMSGYESIALIPIRKGDRIRGLIHLADHLEGMVPERKVEVLEQVAYILGASIVRVQTEEALHEQEKTAQAIFAAAKETIWLIDIDETILMANPTALERLGSREASEVIGHHYPEFMTPELRDARRARIKDVISSRLPVQFEDMRDGIIFDHTFYPVFDAAGAVASIAIFSRDITGFKQAEEALRQSEEQYRMLFNTLTEGFCIIEMLFDSDDRPIDYRFLEINPAFEKQTGLHEAQGKLISGLIPDNEAYCFEIYGKIALTGEPMRFENEAKALNRWYEVSAYRVGGPESRRVAILFNDITERKQAEGVLKIIAENLRASNQELEQFAYIASHDLKEPLRVVTSFSQLLEKQYKGRLDADADEFIRYIVDGAQRMETLISDLLRYSRINQSMHPLEQVDMKHAIEEATLNLIIPIRERNARISQGTMPSIQGDPSQMIQLFQNLIANAIKYCPEDREPEISIDARRTGRDWTFSVKDNGIGIDPVYHEQIFLIFKRLHSRTEYPGTGIGLAICRRIVERHGGRIWVESEEGRGSTFFFTIPDRSL